jgi:hypothetical protein
MLTLVPTPRSTPHNDKSTTSFGGATRLRHCTCWLEPLTIRLEMEGCLAKILRRIGAGSSDFLLGPLQSEEVQHNNIVYIYISYVYIMIYTVYKFIYIFRDTLIFINHSESCTSICKAWPIWPCCDFIWGTERRILEVWSWWQLAAQDSSGPQVSESAKKNVRVGSCVASSVASFNSRFPLRLFPISRLR